MTQKKYSLLERAAVIDDIYNGEIYKESQCLERENVIKKFLEHMLDHYGYVVDDISGRRWVKQDRLVVLCLVDDFNVCGADYSNGPKDWFNKNAVIITDNQVLFSPQYTVLKLPESFYSTFLYMPKLTHWQPVREFHFPMNRGDLQRDTIFKEFEQQRGLSDLDYVNYNAAQSEYPAYRNHQCYIEEAWVQSYINLVVETYAGDSTITFSEKIFRALQTPAPWMLFACRNSIAYLRDIGFDVLDDLIDHGYDSAYQTGLNGIDKIRNWFKFSLRNLETIKQKDKNTIRQRCLVAAEHNRALLQAWKKQWPEDFSKWLSNTVQVLNS